MTSMGAPLAAPPKNPGEAEPGFVPAPCRRLPASPPPRRTKGPLGLQSTRVGCRRSVFLCAKIRQNICIY